MPCKFGKKDGVTFFQCTPGNFEYMSDGVYGPDHGKPYDEGECRHDNRFELKGVLTCKDCCATYNERRMEWQ